MIVLVFAIIVALVLALVFSLKSKDDKPEEGSAAAVAAEDCCGAHEVCETDSLLSHSDEIEYFEDEELDQFKKTHPDSYSDEQIEMFREVLYTLKENEVAAWLKSLQLRAIHPPYIIKEEALMIVAERRGIE